MYDIFCSWISDTLWFCYLLYVSNTSCHFSLPQMRSHTLCVLRAPQVRFALVAENSGKFTSAKEVTEEWFDFRGKISRVRRGEKSFDALDHQSQRHRRRRFRTIAPAANTKIDQSNELFVRPNRLACKYIKGLWIFENDLIKIISHVFCSVLTSRVSCKDGAIRLNR